MLPLFDTLTCTTSVVQDMYCRQLYARNMKHRMLNVMHSFALRIPVDLPSTRVTRTRTCPARREYFCSLSRIIVLRYFDSGRHGTHLSCWQTRRTVYFSTSTALILQSTLKSSIHHEQSDSATQVCHGGSLDQCALPLDFRLFRLM